MILAECGVFAAMCLAGALSAVAVTVLDALGRGSCIARAIGDVMSAAFCGAAYFLTLYFAASGVFRLYALAAFLIGLFGVGRLLKRAEPTVRAFLRRVLLPIVRRYDRLANAWRRKLAPITSKWERKRRVLLEKRRALRENRRASREQKKRARRREKTPSERVREGYTVVIERGRKDGKKRAVKVP